MKLIVFLLMAAVVTSLGSGLFFLAKDERNSLRMLNALRLRVALSIVLILFLVGSYYFGWITRV